MYVWIRILEAGGGRDGAVGVGHTEAEYRSKQARCRQMTILPMHPVTLHPEPPPRVPPGMPIGNPNAALVLRLRAKARSVAPVSKSKALPQPMPRPIPKKS